MSIALTRGLSPQLGLDCCSRPPPLMGLWGFLCSKLTPPCCRGFCCPGSSALLLASFCVHVHMHVHARVGTVTQEIPSALRAHARSPCRVGLGRAEPSFPEPLQPSWLMLPAYSRRMVLLRPPRAQAASFPPSLSPGTGWAGLQPWELRLLLFPSSKLHSMIQ